MTRIGPDVDRVEWLKARQLGITATDIGAIVGLDPWRTPLDVWHEKNIVIDDELDAVDDTDVEAMEWGHRLEPMIAAKFSHAHPEFGVHPSPGLIAAERYPWALATPDRLLELRPDASSEVLEIKTAGARQADKWDDDGTPDQYVVQLQWQLLVVDAPRGFIAALIAGQRYVEREFKRDDELIEILLDRAACFLHEHVHTGEPPEADPWRDAQLLSRIYDVEPKATVQLSGEALLELEHREELKARAKVIEREIAEAEAIVKQEMGGAEIGLDGDRVAVTWKQNDARTLDQKAFKAAHPKLHAEFAPPKPQRRFLPKVNKDNG